MSRVEYPEPLQRLILQLKRLPGIGPRGAERIALWMVRTPMGAERRSSDILEAISQAVEQVGSCANCGFFATEKLCAICQDEARSHSLLCVVEQATDILPLERTGAFRGRYHALGGRLAPLDHIGPDDLNIEGLIERVQACAVEEVILALGADVEGEATAQYLAGLLRETASHLRLTRIAQGLPAGSGLEGADELTLSRALVGRVPMVR